MASIVVGSFQFGYQIGRDLSGSGRDMFGLWSKCSRLLN